MQLLTEGAIRSALLARLDSTSAADSVDAALEYVADRGVFEAAALADPESAIRPIARHG